MKGCLCAPPPAGRLRTQLFDALVHYRRSGGFREFLGGFLVKDEKRLAENAVAGEGGAKSGGEKQSALSGAAALAVGLPDPGARLREDAGETFFSQRNTRLSAAASPGGSLCLSVCLSLAALRCLGIVRSLGDVHEVGCLLHVLTLAPHANLQGGQAVVMPYRRQAPPSLSLSRPRLRRKASRL